MEAKIRGGIRAFFQSPYKFLLLLACVQYTVVDVRRIQK